MLILATTRAKLLSHTYNYFRTGFINFKILFTINRKVWDHEMKYKSSFTHTQRYYSHYQPNIWRKKENNIKFHNIFNQSYSKSQKIKEEYNYFLQKKIPHVNSSCSSFTRKLDIRWWFVTFIENWNLNWNFDLVSILNIL